MEKEETEKFKTPDLRRMIDSKNEYAISDISIPHRNYI